MPSTTALPQKFLRASSHAIAMPNGSATTVATTAMRSDSSIAVHSSGVRSSTAQPLASPSRPLAGRVERRSEAAERGVGGLHLLCAGNRRNTPAPCLRPPPTPNPSPPLASLAGGGEQATASGDGVIIPELTTSRLTTSG